MIDLENRMRKLKEKSKVGRGPTMVELLEVSDMLKMRDYEMRFTVLKEKYKLRLEKNLGSEFFDANERMKIKELESKLRKLKEKPKLKQKGKRKARTILKQDKLKKCRGPSMPKLLEDPCKTKMKDLETQMRRLKERKKSKKSSSTLGLASKPLQKKLL